MREAADDIRMIAGAAAMFPPTPPGATLDPIDAKPGLSAGWRASKLVSALSRRGLFVLEEATLTDAIRAIGENEWRSIVGASEIHEIMGLPDADAMARAMIRELRP